MCHPEATVTVTTDVQIWILLWKLDIWEFEGWGVLFMATKKQASTCGIIVPFQTWKCRSLLSVEVCYGNKVNRLVFFFFFLMVFLKARWCPLFAGTRSKTPSGCLETMNITESCVYCVLPIYADLWWSLIYELGTVRECSDFYQHHFCALGPLFSTVWFTWTQALFYRTGNLITKTSVND